MIHWCGTGLSAVPGLRRLLGSGHDVTVWEADLPRAETAVGDLTDAIRAFDMAVFAAELAKGDVLVAMIPADGYLPLAQLCLDTGAHFVASGYVSEAMRALDTEARDAGVALLHEVGLDPGIDHLMAHDLVARYRASDAFDPANTLAFHAFCGGFPKAPTPFRYKVSWSPIGVLRALSAPARLLRDFAEVEVRRPWEAVTHFLAPLPRPEQFEVIPNRDSLRCIAEYGLDGGCRLRDFVRGTLRPDGWAAAWRDLLLELEGADEARLRTLSEALWREHAYAPGEPDRVVLVVDLKAERNDRPVFHQAWLLDAEGDRRGSAMARLVSVPVSLAVEALLAGEIDAGVGTAPSDPEIVARWLAAVAGEAQHIARIEHV